MLGSLLSVSSSESSGTLWSDLNCAQPDHTQGASITRTLLFAFYTACPPAGGAAAVSYQLARHWPGERVLVQIGDNPGECELAPGFKIITLRYAGRGERWQKLAAVPHWIREMVAIAVRERPEMIVLEGASWSAYHWRLMAALRRCVPAAKLIYHAHNVEYDLRRQKHSRFIAGVTRWCEGRLVARADIATSVSAADAARFHTLYGRDTVLLPNGVDVAWLRGASPASISVLRSRHGITPKTVLFMGGYGYRPNREAIDFLIRDVFPAVFGSLPQARLLLLGGPVPYERPWLIAPGPVPSDDLPAFIQTAAISVAPIFSGSGTRLKIIESLAAGIPVVTTVKGAEGLGLEAGKHVLYAETAKEFQEAILRLLNDPALAERLSSEAAAFVRSEYDWDSLLKRFTPQFQEN